MQYQSASQQVRFGVVSDSEAGGRTEEVAEDHEDVRQWIASRHSNLFTLYYDINLGPRLVSIRTRLYELANKRNVNPRMYKGIMGELLRVLEQVKEGEPTVITELSVGESRKSDYRRIDSRLSAMNCDYRMELSDDQVRSQLESISKQFRHLGKSMKDANQGGQDSQKQLETEIERMQTFLSTIVQSSEVWPGECKDPPSTVHGFGDLQRIEKLNRERRDVEQLHGRLVSLEADRAAITDLLISIDAHMSSEAVYEVVKVPETIGYMDNQSVDRSSHVYVTTTQPDLLAGIGQTHRDLLTRRLEDLERTIVHLRWAEEEKAPTDRRKGGYPKEARKSLSEMMPSSKIERKYLEIQKQIELLRISELVFY